MILRIEYLLIYLVLTFLSVDCNSQSQTNNYEINKLTEGCLVLLKKDMILDTLCLTVFKGFEFKRNQILEVVKNKIIRIEFKAGAIDSFDNSFYRIEQWSVKNDKFLFQNSLKIPLKACQVKRLRFKVEDGGIKWTYKISFLKKEKGIISFNDMKELNKYDLPCCK
jgi:hypothetical protein